MMTMNFTIAKEACGLFRYLRLSPSSYARRPMCVQAFIHGNKPKQSYEVQSHAGCSSTRPQQHTSLATVRPWRFSHPCDLDLWPFDLRFTACLTPVVHYVYQLWC